MRNIKVVLVSIAFAWAGAIAAQPSTNLSGTTGLYMVPSAKVQKPRQVGLGYHFISESNGHVINATAGVINKLEMGYAQMLQDAPPFSPDNDVNGKFFGKYQFVNGKIDWAGYADLQAFGSDLASQWLLVGTVGDVQTFQTSFGFGYTFAPNFAQTGWDFDVYMGLEKNIPGVKILNFIAEFSNRGHAWNQASFNTARGIFNTGVRLGAKSGKLGFNGDFLFTDIFDDGSQGVALGGYITYQL